MNYGQLITEIQNYWDLREKGLKKQANHALFQFTARFESEVSESDADAILFQFCREYLDELKFPGKTEARRHLPFQLSKLLHGYLSRACGKQLMPQMRWMFQIFGRNYNPHDRNGEQDVYHILELAYAHEDCDQQTVDLYFGQQVEFLWWGQHHFPEGCIISREAFRDTVRTAEKIQAEKAVSPELAAAFAYYVRLYGLFYKWHDGGRNGDFSELCGREGVPFRKVPAVYFQK